METNNRKIYIIPGLGDSIESENYQEIIDICNLNNFVVEPVLINWSQKMDMHDYINQADKQIPDEISEDYIFGFSFGAFIAAVLSHKKKGAGYIFCSTSPYFVENLEYIPTESKEYFGQKFMKSLEKYSFNGDCHSKAWFLVGSKDWELAIESAKSSYEKWKGPKEIHIIEAAGHQLDHPNYILKLFEIMKTL